MKHSSMNDTSPSAEQKMNELLAKKSGEERLLMGGSMFMCAKELVIASLEQNGPLPPHLLKQQLFLRFYGDEFDEVQKSRILARLEKS